VDFHSCAPDEELPSLVDWYSWPAGRSWLRCMMLVTLDGAFRGPDGTSRSLTSPADQHVFTQVRRLSDAVLVGAQTLRAEQYEPLVEGEDSPTRLSRGMTPAPVLVVVTSSMDLPWDDAVFRDSTMPPLVVTTEDAPAAAIERARRNCEVITLPGGRLDPFQLASAIAYRGLTHVVCEGGPTLLAQLSRAGLVDEADITIAPVQSSGGQIVTGAPVATPPRLTLEALIEQDGWLFTRYVRDVGPGA